MSRISIQQIAHEIEADGWKIKSSEYKNLDTPLEFECPEGHLVIAPYKKIRVRRECPVCAQNHFKNLKETLAPKQRDVTRTLALDQSTHITGFAIFDGHQLVQYGTYVTEAPGEYERIHEVNMWLASIIKNTAPDVVGIEGIQYQKEMGVTTFQTLARLQGVLIESCMQAKLLFKVCNTNTWRNHCGVQGRSRSDRKSSMQRLVKEWYDIKVSDDVADAIGIGKFVSDTLQSQTQIINWE